MAEIRHLENRHDVIFFCRGWSNLDKISETGAKWHVDCSDVVEIETRKFQYGGRLGEFYGMSSKSHVSHCMVLPLGEFSLTIPEPHCCFYVHVTFIVLCCIVLALAIHSAYFIKRFSLLTAMMSNKLLGHATLQGAVSWRDQCHDRAALQGVRIPSAILKIVFRYIVFFCY